MHTYISLSLPLSLCLYIYIYTHIHAYMYSRNNLGLFPCLIVASTKVRELCGAHVYCNSKRRNAAARKNII